VGLVKTRAVNPNGVRQPCLRETPSGFAAVWGFRPRVRCATLGSVVKRLRRNGKYGETSETGHMNVGKDKAYSPTLLEKEGEVKPDDLALRGRDEGRFWGVVFLR